MSELQTKISIPNSATADGRLLPIGRHYYHIGWTFEYDNPTQLFTLQYWTGGPYANEYARVAFEFGSGDDQGVLTNAGYRDNIQDVTADSIVFTDARKRGSLSSGTAQLVQSIGLQLVGHGRRIALNQTGITASTAVNGVNVVPYGVGGNYNPLDEALCDSMFSAIIKGLECQLLPSNQTSQCAAFLGNCFLMPGGTGMVNSAVSGIGTRDRRGSYGLGSPMLVLPNPNDSQFQPNRLLFSKPVTSGATGPMTVTVNDIPGAAPRTDGEIFVLDMMVFVDSANVTLIKNGVQTFNTQDFDRVEPVSERDQDIIKCWRGAL